MNFNKERYTKELAYLVSNNAITNNDEGLFNNFTFFKDRLTTLNFEVSILGTDSKTPVIYARKKNHTISSKIGMYGHYDVEPTEDGKWSSPPTVLTVKDERIVGRGVGDNLGILLLRLHAIESLSSDELPEIYWLIEGQEEKGSLIAHKEFPMLEIPKIDVWFEETGYFDISTSRQRFLTLNEDAKLTKAKESIMSTLDEFEFTSYTEKRSLTKFEECPFSTHLLKGQPYWAIGPNDEYSKIHQVNESLSLPLIKKSYEQFKELLKYYAIK